jgi:tetratricopeptide (TPR) repeat protein
LTARTFVSMSFQAEVIGWPHEGLHLAKAGQDMAECLSSPAILSLLVAQEGVAHARMGAAKEAVECFARAEYLLGRAEGVHKPTWLTFYDEGELRTIKACGLMYLERYESAENLYRGAAECDDAYLRNKASRTTHLAAAQLSQANVSEAAHTAEAALVALEGGVASTRVISRLRDLREQFRDYRNVAAVSSFYDHYSAVVDDERLDGDLV